MPDNPSIQRYRNWYAKLLRLYPKAYRERFGEGMEQTFNDLCRERAQDEKGLLTMVLWMFIETFAQIMRENAAMKKAAIFLQLVIVLVGMGALALLLWEPHLEGRNAHATVFEIYFKDPFLAYAYMASIAFFVALYQAFKVVGYAGQNEIFSPAAVKALRTIKHCAIAIIGFVAGAEIFIMLQASDDRAGGVFMGILIAFGSIVIAAAASMFERILCNAVDIKSENHLAG